MLAVDRGSRPALLVLMVLFLASFAVTGFGLNLVVRHLFGFWVPAPISSAAAFLITLPIVRLTGAGLARLIPQDQTYAVSFDSLVGRIATIVNGTARAGYPAQAKVAAMPQGLRRPPSLELLNWAFPSGFTIARQCEMDRRSKRDPLLRVMEPGNARKS